MSTTANLNLIKAPGSDTYNVEVQNSNMDIIDAEIMKRVDKTLITAANDFIVGSANGAVVKKTLAQTKTILGVDASTESTLGVIEIATAAEVTTGTDNSRAVTPAGLKVETDKRLLKNAGTLESYTEKKATNAAATGTVTLDLAVQNIFDLTLTGITAIDFSNIPASGKACSVTVLIRQGATPYAVTYPAGVKWSNDVIPDVSTASKTSILTFVTVDGGARWYGFLAGNKFTT